MVSVQIFFIALTIETYCPVCGGIENLALFIRHHSHVKITLGDLSFILVKPVVGFIHVAIRCPVVSIRPVLIITVEKLRVRVAQCRDQMEFLVKQVG